MKQTRTVFISHRASQEISDTTEYYRRTAGLGVALKFTSALGNAIHHVRKAPLTGTRRSWHEANLPDVRMWPLRRGFPHQIYYAHDVNRLRLLALRHERQQSPPPSTAQTTPPRPRPPATQG